MHADSGLQSRISGSGIRMLASRVGWRVRSAPLATNAAFLFANAIVGALLGVLFWTVTARFYNLAAIGLTSAVVSAATLIATFSNLGLSAVVVRYLPVAGETDFRLRIVATLIPGLIAPGAVVVLSLMPAGQTLITDLQHQDVATPSLFVVMAVAMAISFVQDSVFIARRQAGLVLLRGVAATIVRFALLAPLARFGELGLVGLFVAGAIVSVALGGSVWRREVGSIGACPASVRQMAAYGMTNYVSGLLAQAPPMLYPILIATQVSHAAAGAFNFAWMPAALLMTLPPSAANVLLAQLVCHPDKTSRQLQTTIRLIVAVTALMAFGIYICIVLIAPLWLPEGADDVRAFLPILLGGVVLFAVVRLHSMILSWRERLRALFVFNGVVAVVAIGLPIAALPRWGVIGLEAGWLLSQLVGVVGARVIRDRAVEASRNA